MLAESVSGHCLGFLYIMRLVFSVEFIDPAVSNKYWFHPPSSNEKCEIGAIKSSTH